VHSSSLACMSSYVEELEARGDCGCRLMRAGEVTMDGTVGPCG